MNVAAIARVVLLSGHIDQHLQSILAQAEIRLYGIVSQKTLTNDTRRVETNALSPVEQGVKCLPHSTPTVDARPEEVGSHLTQITRDDRRVDNL